MSTEKTNESVMIIRFTFNLYSILSSILTEAKPIKRLQAKGIRKALATINTAIDSRTAISVIVNLNIPELVNDSVVMLYIYSNNNNCYKSIIFHFV